MQVNGRTEKFLCRMVTISQMQVTLTFEYFRKVINSCLLIWVETAIDRWSPFWSNCTICINVYLPWANNCYKPSKETVHINFLSLQWLPIGRKLWVFFAFILLSFSQSKFLTNMKAINLLCIIWTLITIWRYNRFEVHSYCATATGTELLLVWTFSLGIFTNAQNWQYCLYC